jgi:hypothetical protein
MSLMGLVDSKIQLKISTEQGGAREEKYSRQPGVQYRNHKTKESPMQIKRRQK